MLLEKPAFPVSYGLDRAEEKVSNFFISQNAKKFSFLSYDLEYVPYFLFSFDVYAEEDKKTRFLEHNNAALNALTGDLDFKLSYFVFQYENMSKEIKHNYSYKVIQPRISEKEARKIISMKIAAKNQTTKDLVIISGLVFSFIPFWKFNMNVFGSKVLVCINAYDGSLKCEQDFPKKEKKIPKKDELEEAISDVSKPNNWPSMFLETFNYFLAKIFIKGDKQEKKVLFTKLSKEDLLVVVLAFIVIVVIVYALLF